MRPAKQGASAALSSSVPESTLSTSAALCILVPRRDARVAPQREEKLGKKKPKEVGYLNKRHVTYMSLKLKVRGSA